MQNKYYLSACCIIKDEDPFIMEWLTYHSLIGVEHFFIYDNESANPLTENPLLVKFVAQGKVTLMEAPGRAMQMPSYLHCLQNFGHLTKWMAYIDMDEFIFLESGRDLRPFLAAYEDYAALGLNWKCFSSGGHLSSPKGLVIRNYTERFTREAQQNLHIKSIIQPAKNETLMNPHAFFPSPGETSVNVDFRPIPQDIPMTPLTWKKACIHHYQLKSQEDAQRRISRGRADINSDKPTVDNDDFQRMVLEPVEEDKGILRFAGEVEGWLKTGELPEGHSEQLEGTEPEKLLALAEEILGRNDLDANVMNDVSILLCHAAMKEPAQPRLWKLRARLAGMQGEPELAGRYAKRAAECEAGGQAEPGRNLAASGEREQNNRKELPPKQAHKASLEVSRLAGDKNFHAAEELIIRLERDYQPDPMTLLMKATLARLRGNYDSCQEFIYAALKMKEIPQSYQELARLRLEQGRLEEARDLVFYLINTETFRVAEPEFYKPLRELYDILNLRLKGQATII